MDKTQEGGREDKKMSQADTDYGTKGETGEREPKGAGRIDQERKESLKGGVGMGMADKGRKNAEALENIHTKTGDGKNVYHHVREYTKAKY
jgi:hypothetical protein